MLGVSKRAFAGTFAMAVTVAAIAGVLTARSEHAQAYGEQLQRFEHLSKLVPMYPGASFLPLGESVHVGGLGREMGYALTDDSPWKVGERYQGIWESQGLRVARDSMPTRDTVTAYAFEEDWVRTVVATSDGDRTTIIASVRILDGAMPEPSFPIPESCEVVNHTGARDDGVRTQIVYLACEGYVPELIDFYDDLLHGARRNPRAVGEGVAYISYSSDVLEVSLAASQGGGDPPATAATLTWQERP
jgi:hypothetical protein